MKDYKERGTQKGQIQTKQIFFKRHFLWYVFCCCFYHFNMYNYKTKDLHIQISECLGKVYFPVLVNVTNNHNSFLSLAFD